MKPFTYLLFMSIVVGLFSVWMSHSPGYISSDQRQTDTPPFNKNKEEFSYLEPGWQGDNPHEATTTNNLPTWSRLVYQSFIDNNWEIYIAVGDGSSVTRLTNNAVSDIHPRLNRGANKIIFASDLGGDYEIYSANHDGSNLVQLTSNNKDDVLPEWSPDSSKIAFTSYRDGQAEIYVMNSDGGNQTKLTNSPDWDGEASWSPDGSKISFSSYRNGAYRIWVMNQDGTAQMKLSNQPYSENPAWSPDGGRIAYDTDNDSDGFMELWLMNPDGSSQQEIFSPSEAQTDAWVGGWTPDARYITFTRITWVYSNNTWYWTTAYLDAYDMQVPHPVVRISQNNTNWRPYHQTTDLNPPSAFLFLPGNLSHNNFQVSWSGQDNGTSGIREYEIQAREDQGAWIPWLKTTKNLAYFSGLYNHAYSFRVRASDNALNTGSWIESNSIVIFAGRIHGEITDHTGVPVSGTTIMTIPSAISLQQDDPPGSYDAYLGDLSNTNQLSIANPGYLNLPLINLPGSLEIGYDAALPPSDNVVSNWGFEQGQIGPAWQTGVDHPAIISGERIHSGQFSASIGAGSGGMATPIQLTQTGSDSIISTVVGMGETSHVVWNEGNVLNYASVFRGVAQTIGVVPGSEGVTLHALLIDSQGTLHLVWKTLSTLKYSQRPAMGSWSSPANIASLGNPNGVMSFTLGQDGNLYLVYTVDFYSQSTIYVTSTIPPGVWQAPTQLGPQCAPAGYFSMKVLPDGHGYLVYYCGSNTYIRFSEKLPGGSWSSPTNIPTTFSAYIEAISMEVLSNGWVYLAWSLYDGSSWKVEYTHRPPAGDWANRQMIVNNDFYFLKLLADNQDGLHLLWTEDGNCDPVYYSYKRPDSLVWTLPEIISAGQSTCYCLEAELDINDTLHVSWTAGSSVSYIYKPVNGAWSDIQQVPGMPYSAYLYDMDISDYGLVHAAYTQWNGVMVSGPLSTEVAVNSAISQTLALPADSISPWLSFYGFLENPAGSDTTDVKLKVTGNSNSLTYPLNLETLFQWQHQSVDLSAWVGQQITITLQSNQVAGQANYRVFLDEITIGRAYPDLWTSLEAGQTIAEPGSVFNFMIQYGNQGRVQANNIKVGLNLPPELTFVGATPAPTQISPEIFWGFGNLPPQSSPLTTLVSVMVDPNTSPGQTLAIGSAVSSIDMEKETSNNIDDFNLNIARILYMPLILR